MPIVLPDLDVEKVKRWCRARVPAKFKDEVRLEVNVGGKSVSIHERRPVWNDVAGEWTNMPIAQLRDAGDGAWTLYSGDRYGKWTLYLGLEATQPIDVILDEIDADPTSVFWG